MRTLIMSDADAMAQTKSVSPTIMLADNLAPWTHAAYSTNRNPARVNTDRYAQATQIGLPKSIHNLHPSLVTTAAHPVSLCAKDRHNPSSQEHMLWHLCCCPCQDKRGVVIFHPDLQSIAQRSLLGCDHTLWLLVRAETSYY